MPLLVPRSRAWLTQVCCSRPSPRPPRRTPPLRVAPLAPLLSSLPPPLLPPRPLIAVFCHDFNLLYLRSLLRAHWLTSSWPFDNAPTASHLRFQLFRDQDGPAPTHRVRGTLVTGSVEQQAENTPYTPPHDPPASSLFLDLPYPDFRAAVLEALEPSCVAPPLRASLAALAAAAAAPPPTDAQPSRGGVVQHDAGMFFGGVLCGLSLCLGVIFFGLDHHWRRQREAGEPRGAPAAQDGGRRAKVGSLAARDGAASTSSTSGFHGARADGATKEATPSPEAL